MLKRVTFLVIIYLLFSINRLFAQQVCVDKGQNPDASFPACGSSVFRQDNVPQCGNFPVPVSPCRGDGFVYTDINPFFYKFTCFKTGLLGFLIKPINPTDDYDWQIFDITNHNPRDIYTDPSLIVACNWSGNTGATGATAAGVDVFNCGGIGFSNKSAMPTVIQGHEYLLLVSNFSPSQLGYDLTFSGGTTTITDLVNPKVIDAAIRCSGDKIGIKLNKRMLCKTIAPDGSDFAISTNPTIDSVVGVGCKYGFDMDSITINLKNQLPIGTYTLTTQTGTDGNTITDICGTGTPVGQMFSFNVVKQFPTLMDSITTPLPCAPQQLQLVFSKKIKCNSVATDGSDFTITGPSAVAIDNITMNCDSNGVAPVITVKLKQPITVDGQYTITLKDGVDLTTIINECSVPTPVGSFLNFQVLNKTNPAFAYKVLSGCKQDTSLLTYIGFNNGQNNTNSWHWYLGDSLISMGRDTSFISNQFMPKTIKLVVSNGICSDSSTQIITPLDHSIKADYSAPDTICPNVAAVVKDLSTGVIVDWKWNFGDTIVAGQQPTPHLYPAINTIKTYLTSLIVTNQTRCMDTTRKTITVKAYNPSLIDSVTEVFCAPTNIQLVLKKPIQCNSVAADGSNFSLTGAMNIPITAAAVNCVGNGLGNTINITLSSPLKINGIYNLKIAASNGKALIGECGIPTPDTTISFKATHNVSAAFDTAVFVGCKQDTLIATHNGLNNIINWSWTLGSQVSNVQNPTFIYTDFNPKPLKLVVSNGICKDSSSLLISSSSHLIKAAFASTDTICSNSSALFTNNSQGNIINWLWAFGNGDTSFSQSPAAETYPAIDTFKTYYARLIIQNAIGCYDTTVYKTIVVKPAKPSQIDSMVPLPCAPKFIQLVFKSALQCSSVAIDGSNFSITGPSAVSIASAAVANCVNGLANTVQINLAQPIVVPGNYQLTIKKDATGNQLLNACNVPTPLGSSIVFRALNAVNASFIKDIKIKYGCKQDTISYSHDGLNNVVKWHWYFDSTYQSTQKDTALIYDVFTPKLVKLYVANDVCADSTVFIPISLLNEKDTIKAGFSIQKIHGLTNELTDFICPVEKVIVVDTSIGIIHSWAWDFADGLSPVTIQAPPTHSYPNIGKVKVYPIQLIIQGNYCTDTVYRNLKVIPNCYIAVPGAFTPNGDGKNDYLFPLNAYKADNLNFKVFDRYGKVVFETHDFTKQWDGKLKGNEQVAGTYVWILTYTDHDTGEYIAQHGTTVIVR